MYRRSWVLFASASWVACSSTNASPPPSDAGPDVVNATLDGGGPDAQGTAVTQTVGASGGTVRAEGAVLTIPAGALASDVQISLARNAAPVPAGFTALSPVFSFKPDGTTFLSPATLVLTLTTSGANPTIFSSQSAGGYAALSTTVSSKSVSAAIDQLGNCFVGVGQPRVADASAGDTASPTDAGPTDTGTSDATLTDAAIDGSSATDAGFQGITVTIDGVTPPTIFAVNPQASLSGPDGSVPNLTTIQADDNATSTHWHLELVVTQTEQERCQPEPDTYPTITYSHYTAGQIDSTFSSTSVMSECSILVTGIPTASGGLASGTFSGTLLGPAGTNGSHVFSMGSYDMTIP
jgi:hypothetical protein